MNSLALPIIEFKGKEAKKKRKIDSLNKFASISPVRTHSYDCAYLFSFNFMK